MSGTTCPLCLVRLENHAEMRAHFLSQEHILKMKVAGQSSLSQATSVNTPMNNEYRCEPCEKRFAGPIPYKQHLDSEKHMKKLRHLELGDSNSPANQGTDFLYCEPCGKKFAGQVPYNQHVISERHLKKMRESIGESNSSDSSLSPTKSFCTLCNMSFGNHDELLKHTSSNGHRLRSLQNINIGGSSCSPTAEEKEARDVVIRVVANHTRDFLVCPADVSFLDFVKEHNLFES